MSVIVQSTFSTWHGTGGTHYWRDRRKDGQTYHLDYIFAPHRWATNARDVELGSFDEWIATKLSDNVPLTVDLAGVIT